MTHYNRQKRPTNTGMQVDTLQMQLKVKQEQIHQLSTQFEKEKKDTDAKTRLLERQVDSCIRRHDSV